jgi:hypothetical protein
LPATGAPDRASGKPNPLAINTTGTPGANVAAEIAADVPYRSTPDRRVATGETGTTAGATVTV